MELATQNIVIINYPKFSSLIGRGLLCFSIGVLLYGIYKKTHKKVTAFADYLSHASLGLTLIYFIMSAITKMYLY